MHEFDFNLYNHPKLCGHELQFKENIISYANHTNNLHAYLLDVNIFEAVKLFKCILSYVNAMGVMSKRCIMPQLWKNISEYDVK